mmetsp:Transcript_19897/g.45191  ORF Transcript_19897/g.45191 Transcript_19897/m.45191 type:complete len:238 (+) Transcript_19897:292-1005(+)
MIENGTNSFSCGDGIIIGIKDWIASVIRMPAVPSSATSENRLTNFANTLCRSTTSIFLHVIGPNTRPSDPSTTFNKSCIHLHPLRLPLFFSTKSSSPSSSISSAYAKIPKMSPTVHITFTVSRTNTGVSNTVIEIPRTIHFTSAHPAQSTITEHANKYCPTASPASASMRLRTRDSPSGGERRPPSSSVRRSPRIPRAARTTAPTKPLACRARAAALQRRKRDVELAGSTVRRAAAA